MNELLQISNLKHLFVVVIYAKVALPLLIK